MAKAAKSFKEIVDEEYALKVQKQINYKSDEDEELLLALKLSKEIEENKNIDNNEVSELDEDFVYALQLQEEFDKQREDEDINFMKAKSKQHNFEKITVSFDKHRSIPSHSLTDPFSDEENEDEDEDELGGDDNFRSFENNRNTYATRMQSKANKPNGRVAKEIITKHNLEISGKVNAFNLENNLSANFGDLSDLNVPISNNIYSSLKTHADRSESRRIRYHGKEDRETREHVMDPRTRILLYKMLNNGLLSEVGGILSTGKEANVYLGITDHLPSHLLLTTQKSKNDRIGESTEGTYAIKIYKTTLNEFKNRDLYIKYDFRFRYKHNKQNPRKFIAVWAEKERDNLMRMKRVGIRCPEVILLRKHILVLQFIGENGIPAPHLRDVILSFSDEKITELYLQCILMMRKLFQECKLVHADLSEYNLLYYADQLWVIDVAQAVEHEHPFALSFLKRDCENLNRFFRAAGAKWLMSVKELFIFITDVNITRENELNYLHSIEELCISRGELTDQQQLEDEIFMNSFIPRHLKDVEDPAYEMQLSKDDINLFVFHQSLTGMKSDLSGPSSSPIFDQKISDDDDDDDEEFDDEYEVKVWEERPKLTREEQKQLRKEAKKRYKLQKRQNQTTSQNSNNEELTTEQS